MKRLLTILLVAFSSLVAFAQEADEQEQIVKSVFFGGGSWYIDAEQVQEIKDFLAEHPNIESYTIAIVSHTDNIGGKEYNQWLSERRSQSVAQQLIMMDIPADIITIESQGQNNPLYDNDTWNGRLGNRRVDIFLLPLVM